MCDLSGLSGYGSSWLLAAVRGLAALWLGLFEKSTLDRREQGIGLWVWCVRLPLLDFEQFCFLAEMFAADEVKKGSAFALRQERFDVDMRLKGVCEAIHQALAVFGVVHLKGCQVIQSLAAAELVQPVPAPAAVVQ